MEDRKNAFENKYAHDEEVRFRAEARRNKLLGLWAAEKLGKKEADADAYVTEVIKADFHEAGDDDVFRKLRSDFDTAGVDVSDHRIRRTMEEFMIEAIRQIEGS